MKNISIVLALFSLSVNASFGQNQPVKNKFNDVGLQRIHTHAYNRNTDSVRAYLTSKNPVYRAEAALMFSSMQDSAALPALCILLNDPARQVRINTAFSLGQIKSTKAAEPLIAAIRTEKDNDVKRVELGSLGRCANITALDFMCTYKNGTAGEKEGLAWGLYRAALRKVQNNMSDSVVSSLLRLPNAQPIRHGAAYYFSLVASPLYEDQVLDVVLHDPSADVRMGILRGLRNIKTDKARNVLVALADTAKDYRIRVDALSVLKQYNVPEVARLIWSKLKGDPHISVRIIAAEYFTVNRTSADYQELLTQSNAEQNWRIRAILLEAAFTVAPNKLESLDLITKLFSQATNKHEKIQLATIAGTDTAGVRFLKVALPGQDDREVTAAMFTPVRRLYSGGNLPADSLKEFAQTLKLFIGSGNKYLVSLAARSILNSDNVRQYVDTTWLYAANKKWRNENYKTTSVDLMETLASFRRGYEKPNNTGRNITSNYEVFNWNDITAIPADQKLNITTTRGSFTIRLFVEEAPFTVAHVLNLVRAGAFNNLLFYRVIPNFVNQTGGTPSPEFDSLTSVKIRSEYNFRPHGERTVNMASSGRDTESSHWSVMLRPTPWNDYGYTVWGEVVEGMELVNRLEMGDRIVSASLL